MVTQVGLLVSSHIRGKMNQQEKAGDVTITTDSRTTIVMTGNESVGILGQSVGGAGGNTGFAVRIANLGGKVVQEGMQEQ